MHTNRVLLWLYQCFLHSFSIVHKQRSEWQYYTVHGLYRHVTPGCSFSTKLFLLPAPRNIQLSQVSHNQIFGLWIHHVITAFISAQMRKKHIYTQFILKWIVASVYHSQHQNRSFSPFFLFSPVVIVHPSDLFRYFCSFPGLPSPPFFLFSLHNWDITVL